MKHPADILDPKSLRGAFKGIEIVYHLAARADLGGKVIDDYKVNFIGTKNVLEESSKAKTVERVVFYSTQLVVGLFNETRFIDSKEPYRTKTVYGESKIEGEKIVKKLCQRFNMPYTIIRPTSVYGPWGQEPYKAFFKTIRDKRYFHIGKASNLVSWVYVKNLVDFTIYASLSLHAKNQTYFGNDFHPYTMREIVNTVGDYYGYKVKTVPNLIITPIAYLLGIPKALGVNVPIYPFRLKNIKSNYCYDIQNAVEIGYIPKYDLATGIKETLDWYEARSYL